MSRKITLERHTFISVWLIAFGAMSATGRVDGGGDGRSIQHQPGLGDRSTTAPRTHPCEALDACFVDAAKNEEARDGWMKRVNRGSSMHRKPRRQQEVEQNGSAPILTAAAAAAVVIDP
jgi:hypothetical protein